ncbi:MAG: tetratricopeptide repeat protein [Chlorobi bacterium]|nr:tetratricopeptide repeat protein [Chlorobiota bacterium]
MKNLICLILLFSVSALYAQESNLKDKALEEFKQEHYNEAINLMEEALKDSPDDATIYYYLGFFNHYRAYDSRPLKGYDLSYSNKIFKYLDKAIELNPGFGNAKYFYGAECSGNAFAAMQNYDLGKIKYYYDLAYKKGAYPNWLLEFGRNILSSCDKESILFTGGNADFDVCLYLQLFENFRTDITLIPIGNIDRPWYVKFLKDGLKGGVRKISINLTDDQIFDIHPFKWDTTTVIIPISQELQEKYALNGNYKMQWALEPDLFSERNHSKIEGEKIRKRTYLSPQRAILLEIVEDNFQSRPIYFSNATDPFFYGGLDLFFQNCGLVSELLPFNTEQTEYGYNYQKIERLLQKDNLKDYYKIKETDIPRISGIVFGYHNSILILARYYSRNNKSKLKDLEKLFMESLCVGYKQDYEKLYSNQLEKITNEER